MVRQLALIPLTLLVTALLQQQPATSRQPQLTVRLKATLGGHSKAIDRIAFSPDGTVVTTSSEDLTVRVWDVETGVLKAILSGDDKAKWERDRWYYNWPLIKAHDFPASFVGPLKDALDHGASAMAVSPDRRLIITRRPKDPDAWRMHEFMELWDLASGELKLTFAEIPYGITEVTWSPEGKTVIVEGENRTKTRLMDVQTGRVKAALPYETCSRDSWFGDNGCSPFIFNADGTVFAKAKHPFKLWDSSTGQLLEELKSAHSPAQFSPTDHTILVTRSKDKRTALLWELKFN